VVEVKMVYKHFKETKILQREVSKIDWVVWYRDAGKGVHDGSIAPPLFHESGQRGRMCLFIKIS